MHLGELWESFSNSLFFPVSLCTDTSETNETLRSFCDRKIVFVPLGRVSSRNYARGTLNGYSTIISKFLAVILALCLLTQFSLYPVLAASAALHKSAVAPESATVASESPAVDFTLTAVDCPETKNDPSKEAVSQVLSDQRVMELVGRLAPAPRLSVAEFRLPEQSLVKPKLPGTIVLETFPPKQTSTEKPKVNAVEAKPLRVARVSPQGSVDDAHEITVTFSQPMVAIAEAKVADPGHFLKLSPQPDGQWEWAGTQTLLFHPGNVEKRLPKSTNYDLTVPSGVRAASGAQTSEAQHWQIITPTLVVTSSYPNLNQPLSDTPLIVQIYNQKIDRKVVLEHMRLTDGKNDFAIHQVDQSALDNKADYKNFVDTIPDNHWITIQPDQALPLDRNYQLIVKAGCPSPEGPEQTKYDNVTHFSVHGPLKLLSPPKDNLLVDNFSADFRFNNELLADTDATRLAPVSISPTIPEYKVFVSGNTLIIRGKVKPFQKYTVTIDGALTDIFNQKLGKTISHSFVTGPRLTHLESYSDFITIAPDQKPVVSMVAQATPEVSVRIFRVGPEDWKVFKTTERERNRATQIGTQVAADTFKIGLDSKPVNVDLAPYLLNGHGQFVVAAKCWSEQEKKDISVATWVQVSNIGLAALHTNKLTALATSLIDGKPVVGAIVRLVPDQSIVVSAATVTTDSTGQAALEVEDERALINKYPGGQPPQFSLITVQKGDDLAILPLSSTNVQSLAHPTIRWYCVSDRTLYRPGETVMVKGWARGLRHTDKGAVDLFDAKLHTVAYVLNGRDGTDLAHGEAKVDSAGGFVFPVALPQKTNLGNFEIKISAVAADLAEFAGTASGINRSANQSPTKDYSTSISISVEEFRRPEFVIKVKAPENLNALIGDKTRLSSESSYFSGGALPHAEVTWTARAIPWTFAPPGYPQYNFSSTAPYWDRQRQLDRWPVTKTAEAKSNAQGESAAELTVTALKAQIPYLFSCEATMFDVNRQQWSTSTAYAVHPAETYVGLKVEPALHESEPVKVKMLAADIDGNLNAGRPIDLRLLHQGEHGGIEEVFKKEFVSASEPLELKFQLKDASEYELVAVVTDRSGRKCQTTNTLGRQRVDKNEPRQNWLQRLTLTPDKTIYQPGDVAVVKLDSEVFPAHGIALISRHGVITSMPLEMAAPTQKLELPISADDYPNLTVEVLLDGKQSSYAWGCTEIAVPPREKSLTLTVKPEQNEVAPGGDTSLNIDLKDSHGAAVSGGHVAVAAVDESLLALRDYKWHDPLQVFYPSDSVSVIGEFSRSSILLHWIEEKLKSDKNISNSQDHNLFQVEPTIMDERHYTSGRQERHQLAQISSVDRYTFFGGNAAWPRLAAMPAPLQRMRSVPEGAPVPDSESGDVNKSRLITERSNFAVLALFAPDIITDKNGHASVPMRLPDSVTNYKIMAAVVAALDKYGVAEAKISTRIGLAIKPSPPRFLNFGDAFELPLVIQNQTDKTISADVVVRAQNALISGIGPGQAPIAGWKIEVPANDRIEVRFPLATKDIGKMDIQCAVISSDLTDAANLSIPVFMPATMETFATYGQIDHGAGEGAVVQKLNCPKEIFRQVGGLKVTTSSTALQALSDAYAYLCKYPYACSEQLSSRLIAMLSLHDVLVAFERLTPDSEAKYKQEVQDTIDVLAARQGVSGDFGLWGKDESEQWPYVSLQVSQALLLAQRRDYLVDATVLQRCRDYLKAIDNHIPANYSVDAKLSLEARALNIRYRDNDIDPNAARLVVQNKTQINLEMAAWLLPVLSKNNEAKEQADLLRQLINNSIEETASNASSNSPGYGFCDYLMFYSPRRADAAVLEALIEDSPDSELIPKLAKGLLAHKKNGAWDGTQENYCVLQALDKYFAVFEKETPNFKSQEWLGEGLIGSQKFVGRSTESKEINIPMDYLLKNLSDQILIEKTGAGRLYYRLGLEYAPRNLNLKPAHFGFEVEREYEAIDDPSDVKKDNDGIWHFKAGATVRVKLHFKNIGVRYHVALIDPLPAGAEPINASFSGNRTLIEPTSRTGDRVPGGNPRPGSSRRRGERGGMTSAWWRHSWFEHQNLRDHEAEAFTSLLTAGEHDYSYMMRATTPGSYVVPPAKVEEMYSSETFGRTGTEHVIVE